MLEQNREMIKQNTVELKPVGMVSVCTGDGIASIFKDLLVDNILTGGQTMNPSADDIAKAADAVLAEDVIIFPNNKNIILAADLAKQISKRRIHIVPTVNIPQGVSAALSFDPELSITENLENMNEAISKVVAGQVTYAVRTTQSDGFDLKEGDIIGIDNKAIVAKGDSVDVVTKQLVDNMIAQNSESINIANITLYFGSDVSQDEADQIADELGKSYPRCDVSVHLGGQPLYYYIVSVE
jgi:hypothetical protein